MKYKILSVEEQTTNDGKKWYKAEVEDNGERKTISCFNFKPEEGIEYDLVLNKKGDYIYGNLSKTKFTKGSKGSGRPEGSYPDKEERELTKHSIEGQATIRTIFPVVYKSTSSRKEMQEEVDFWYNHFMKLIKK
jgi:hypothetical protein